MPRRAINPEAVPPPVGQYAHATEWTGPGSLIFISGQIPEAADGSVPEGFEAQCRLVWAHIRAILEAAGLGVGSLLKVTTFLADVRFAEVNGRVRRDVLGSHEPSLTVVGAALLDPRWLLEIEAIAGPAGGNRAA
jgi:enamine deaminase RidA (YjgF/YER057c/UK114 family)